MCKCKVFDDDDSDDDEDDTAHRCDAQDIEKQQPEEKVRYTKTDFSNMNVGNVQLKR